MNKHPETRAAWELIKEVELFAAKVKLAGVVILLIFLAIVYVFYGSKP